MGSDRKSKKKRSPAESSSEGKNKRHRSSETKSDEKERDSDRKHKLHKSSSTKGVWNYYTLNFMLVEMAMVTIHVLTEDTVQPENVECTSGAELKFANMGTNWFGKQEAITTLNVAYKTLWSSMLELDIFIWDYCCKETVLGQIKAPFTKYFPNFDQPFEEVIYPKGDVDVVSISKRDVYLLLPDTFVNDTLIDFYVKYLKNKIRPEERQRFHFFNSFVFRKLADPEKEPLDALEGKTAFQRVRNYHWSLIVMCHLGEVAKYKDEEDVTELIKVPCVLHMDPIRGSHTHLKGLMQSYLKEEWKGRQQEASEDISSRFDNLRFISLEVTIAAEFIRLWFILAPLCRTFLNTDWFPPADASLKRVVIQRLVYDLLQQPYDEAEAFYKVFSQPFDQPFEEVIYPKEDVDVVSISKRDVDLLLPNTFVNDTIIDFYVKYLKNKISKMKPLDSNLAALSAK
ncbi:hypothetical protein Lser_V15G22369 [Lactuca serriola]